MYYLTIIKANGDVLDAQQETCPELGQLKQAVGGWIETVPYWEHWEGRSAVAFCNEEGKLDGLSHNPTATALWHKAIKPIHINDILCGDIVIISADTPEEMAEL